VDELSNPETADSKSHFNHTDHNPNITAVRLPTQWGIWTQWYPQKHSMLLRDAWVIIFSVSCDEFLSAKSLVIMLEQFIDIITGIYHTYYYSKNRMCKKKEEAIFEK